MHARITVSGVAALFVAVTFSNTAIAQSVAVYGGVEGASDHSSLFFAGGTVSPSGLGWKPYAGLSAYNLHFDAGPGSITRNAFVPRVGLINVMGDHSLSFGVGYSFSDASSDIPFLVPGESGKGVVGTVGYNYWDNGSSTRQLLGSYNFGTNFLWSRGQLLRSLRTGSPLQVGGEVALLGSTSSPSAWEGQIGPVVDYTVNNQFHLGGAVGLETGLSNVTGGPWVYGRLEFLWLPTARR